MADRQSSNNSDIDIDISELTYAKCFENRLKAREILTDEELSRCFRVAVMGYPITLREEQVIGVLMRHFSSCGDICRVVIPVYVEREVLYRRGYVYFRDEGAINKALALDGENVGFPFPLKELGGWDLFVRPARPILCEYSYDQVDAARRLTKARDSRFFVKGYPTSLPADDVKRALVRLLRSCGEIRYMAIEDEAPGSSPMVIFSGLVRMAGEDALAKALKLSGTDMGGWKVTVYPVPNPSTKVAPSPVRSRTAAEMASLNADWEGPVGHRWIDLHPELHHSTSSSSGPPPILFNGTPRFF